MLKNISLQIEGADELHGAIEASLANPREQHAARRRAALRMFDRLDGKAGLRRPKPSGTCCPATGHAWYTSPLYLIEIPSS